MRGIEKFMSDMAELVKLSEDTELVCKVKTGVDIVNDLFMVRIFFDLPDGRNINIGFDRSMHEEG